MSMTTDDDVDGDESIPHLPENITTHKPLFTWTQWIPNMCECIFLSHHESILCICRCNSNSIQERNRIDKCHHKSCIRFFLGTNFTWVRMIDYCYVPCTRYGSINATYITSVCNPNTRFHPSIHPHSNLSSACTLDQILKTEPNVFVVDDLKCAASFDFRSIAFLPKIHHSKWMESSRMRCDLQFRRTIGRFISLDHFYCEIP